MAIPKDKKRLTVTLSSQTIEALEKLVELQDSKVHTYSKIVDLAVIYFYLTLCGVVNKEEKENETHANS